MRIYQDSAEQWRTLRHQKTRRLAREIRKNLINENQYELSCRLLKVLLDGCQRPSNDFT